MGRVRPRARHKNGAADCGVRDGPGRLVIDTEPDAERRLIACISADLLLADDRQHLLFQWMHFCLSFVWGITCSRPLQYALLRERFDARNPCDACKRPKVCGTDEAQAQAAECAIPTRECAIFGDPFIVKA